MQGTFGRRLDEVEKTLSPAGQHDVGLISGRVHHKRGGSLAGYGPLVQLDWSGRKGPTCKFVKRSPERV